MITTILAIIGVLLFVIAIILLIIAWSIVWKDDER